MKQSQIFNSEKCISISHWDLDGVFSPILLKHCFGDQIKKVSPCGYGKLDAVIKKNACKNLIITDLSLTQKQIDDLDELYQEVIWIDHHLTSKGLDYPNHWTVMIDTRACATKLVYLWLQHIGYDLSVAKEFVDATESYDMWRHDDPNGMILNNIFWDINFWKFMEAFKDFKWDPILMERAKEIEVEKHKAISEMETYVIEDILRVTIGSEYISDITLHYPEEKHQVIISGKNKLSIRSSNDLSEFYTILNDKGIEAGGHKNAGGVTYPGDSMEVIEEFYNFVRG